MLHEIARLCKGPSCILWVLRAQTLLAASVERCDLMQVIKGADVVQNIEKAKTNKDDKPYDDIKIVNIEVKGSVE